MRRVLAIDLGSKRIGLAISDATGTIAQGLETLQKQNNASDYDKIIKICRSRGVEACVVGFPLHLSGGLSEEAQRVTGWVEGLKKVLGCPVELWDERLTSREATRTMIRAGLSRKRQKEKCDIISATLILQNYLEHLRFEEGKEASFGYEDAV